MMDMLLRTYKQELQWAIHCSETRKKLLTGELHCAKAANYKEHSLDCNTVCSRDLDIDYSM